MVHLSCAEDAIVNWWRLEPKTVRGCLKEGRTMHIAKLYSVSERTIRSIIYKYQKRYPAGNVAPHHINPMLGVVGAKSKLTGAKREAMYAVAQQYIDDEVYCSDRLLQEGRMRVRGHVHSLYTIQRWKKLLGGNKFINRNVSKR